MSLDRDTHPGEAELHQFVAGKLDESRSAAIEHHLVDCLACSDLLDANPGEDAFVRLIRDAEATRPADSPNITRRDSTPDATLAFQPDSGRPVDEPLQADGAAHVQIKGYEILDELGRGGMGVVYRARHLELKRDVALKVILSGAHSGPEERRRFRQEAETIARLQHAGIVQIYDVGEHDGHPYLALELVQGQTLSDFTQSQPQPIRWSATMVLQLARAVHFAHQQAIVHRDLKPGNVLLLQPQGSESDSAHTMWSPGVSDSSQTAPQAVPVAKITDFGLAKQLDTEHQLTQTGFAVGTPAYMAPEQASGNALQVGPAADIYALGAILYELLTGRPPFAEEDVMATVMALMEDEAVSPRKLRPETPRDLETICLKCLSKQPALRYASAQDLAIDLELYLQGEPIHARPLGIGGRLLRWARRRPVLAATYLACAAFCFVHLVARFALRLPWHVEYGAVIIVLFCIWASSTTALQWLWDRGRFQVAGRVLYVILGATGMTVMFSLESGPGSAPIPALLVGIAASPFFLPRPAMIWCATGICIAAYGWLQLHAWLWRPENLVSVEQFAAFQVCLLLMGVTTHLMLRRSAWRNPG